MEHQTLKRALIFVEIVFVISAIISCIAMIAAKLAFWLILLPLIGVICSITIIEALIAILEQAEQNAVVLDKIVRKKERVTATSDEQTDDLQSLSDVVRFTKCKSCGCMQKLSNDLCISCGEKLKKENGKAVAHFVSEDFAAEASTDDTIDSSEKSCQKCGVVQSAANKTCWSCGAKL